MPEIIHIPNNATEPGKYFWQNAIPKEPPEKELSVARTALEAYQSRLANLLNEQASDENNATLVAEINSIKNTILFFEKEITALEEKVAKSSTN